MWIGLFVFVGVNWAVWANYDRISDAVYRAASYIVERRRRKSGTNGRPEAVYSRPISQNVMRGGEGDDSKLSPIPPEWGGLMPVSLPTPKETFEDRVAAFEKEHNSRLVFINHDRKKKNSLGIDFDRFFGGQTLSTRDATTVLDILRETPEGTDLDLVLHTSGGNMSAAEVIVKALIDFPGQVRVHVPFYAQSAGTLIALCGHEIYIGSGGWLTQVDPQMGWGIAAASLMEYTDGVPAPEDVRKTWFSDLARLLRISAEKAMNRAIELMVRINLSRGRQQDNLRLQELLVRGQSNHDRPITKDLIGELPGLHFGIDDRIMRLFKEHSGLER